MKIFKNLFSKSAKMRVYVLTAWTAYESESIYAVTTEKLAADGWLLSKSPEDGNMVQVWDIASDGSSEQVAVLEPDKQEKKIG